MDNYSKYDALIDDILDLLELHDYYLSRRVRLLVYAFVEDLILDEDEYGQC